MDHPETAQATHFDDLDRVLEETPGMSIPRNLSPAQCFARAAESSRARMAGRFGDALSICTQDNRPADNPLLSEG